MGQILSSLGFHHSAQNWLVTIKNVGNGYGFHVFWYRLKKWFRAKRLWFGSDSKKWLRWYGYDAFFCDLNISLSGIRTPKPKFLKNKKISLEKLPWICTKKSQKPKAIPLNKKSPPPLQHTNPRSVKKTKVIPLNKKSPPGIRTPDLSTFAANLSKKMHAKNLKIFFKKFFLKKTCFGGTKKKHFFFFLGGGVISIGNSQEKVFRSQKKASLLQKKNIDKQEIYCAETIENLQKIRELAF